MTDPFFPIERLRCFSADGQVYRAFNHLIAARMGTLLLVPIHLVTGRCEAVLDGCPVPWEEVHAVLEYPNIHPVGNPVTVHVDEHMQQLEYLRIDPRECELDYITPMVLGNERVLRLVHPCGLRYAVVRDRV